mgnify:CR=1 FL=1
MHLKDVAVPVRIRTVAIGDAHVVCARTRPKYIGGSRAAYDGECPMMYCKVLGFIPLFAMLEQNVCRHT